MLSALALCLASVTVRSAMVDVTPFEPLPLGGYTERGAHVFEPGGQRLQARTLLFESDGRKLAWIAFETLTVPESLVEHVRRTVPKGTDIVISATHTHCAPDSQMLNDRMTFAVPGIASYKSKWLAWTAEALARSVRKASAASQQPAETFEFRQARTEMNRGRRGGTPPDPKVSRISTDGMNLFEVFAAHPVLLDQSHRKLDGEWPGRLMRRTGALPVLGAMGDASPVPPEGKGDVAPELFAEELQKHLDSAKVENAGSGIDWTFEPVELGPATPHPEFAKTNKVPDVLAKLAVAKFAPPTAEIVVLRLGKVLLVGIPGEPTAAVGLALTEVGTQAGFEHTLILSHVGGWMGYILTAKEYGLGGYEPSLAFHGPGLSDRLRASVVRAVQRISQTR